MTNHNRVRISKLAIGLAIALAAAPAFAQNTTSALGGRISNTTGQPVAGTEVTIVHTESGSVSKATTDADGRYLARGLRVGGPYTITTTINGKTETREGVYLELAETGNVDIKSADTTTLAAVQVTATRSADIFDSKKMGAGTNISRSQLNSLASIQRNLQDYARTDPRVAQTDKGRGEISVGGQNTRYNSVTIDGVTTSDTFGLEANNLPTAKQPISIDAIQSVQVNVSNYDVTQTGYTGANINAVTKSGTNDFHGSFTYVYRDQSAIGDLYSRPFGTTPELFTDFPDFKETTEGVTFGGPIVEDTLFFFLGYERFRSSRLAPDIGVLGDPAGRFPNLTSTDVQNAINTASTTWGMTDVGDLTIPSNLETSVDDILAKFDWNISDNHRVSIRYNKTDESNPILPNLTATTRAVSLSSHWYSQEKTFESVVAQWFANWTDNLSSELKVSDRSYDSIPTLNSNRPQVAIQYGPSASRQTLRFGTERSRQANALSTDTLNAYFAFNWFLGDHELKFGVDHDKNDIYNLFLQDVYGQYTFTSQANFALGRPSLFQVQVALPGFSISDGAADWTLSNTGVFIQDTWQINDKLTMTYGLRLDTPSINEVPVANSYFDSVLARTVLFTEAPVLGALPTAGVAGRQFARQTLGYGRSNQETIDGVELFQPRVGFNYTFDSERPTQLRGGVGLFQGAAANVWMSNPFSNTGMTSRFVGCGGSFAGCSAVTSIFTANPNQATAIALLPASTIPAANVDLIEKGLAQPSVWKANIAFEHELPFWGLVASAELIHTQVNSGIYYQNLNLGLPTTYGTDGRELYYNDRGLNPACWSAGGSVDTVVCTGATSVRSRARSNLNYNNVLIARETKQGGGDSATFSLSYPMKNDWSWLLAYTFTTAEEVSPLTSSTSFSNWSNNNTFNPNEEVAGNSNYLIKDRFSGTVNWKHNFFGDYKTTVGLTWESRSGKPYSWTFFNDANGDGVSGNDLLYIPTSEASSEVLFRTAADQTAFWAYVNSHPELANARGTVVKRNSSFASWANSFDVRFSQELPGFFEGNKTIVTLDILNIGNLINKDWGHIYEIDFPSNRSFVSYAGIDAASGRYIYTTITTPEDLITKQARGESQWGAQLTVKYEF
jgi:hypothetical protein